MAFTTGDNNFGTAKWIVDATAGQGTHTTIGAAITAASSGQDIFIRPGTYTENLTLKAGVNLIAFSGDDDTPNVTIVGKCSFTSAGTVSISNIRLKTNADFCLSVTGIAASIVNLFSCTVEASNNTAIQFSSSSSSAMIELFACNGLIDTTGITYFSHSSAGLLDLNYCQFANSGLSTTASTVSAGQLNMRSTGIGVAISISGSTIFSFSNSAITPKAYAVDVVCLTTSGTAAGQAIDCDFETSTSSAISIGAGTNLNLFGITTLYSSNTNTITGSGTVNYGIINFTGSSSGVNVSTFTGLPLKMAAPTLASPLTVPNGGTGASTLTGVLIGNGTSAVTGNSITQHDVLVGGASNSITSVAPSATTGSPLISAGASANPGFSTTFTINDASTIATLTSSNNGGFNLIQCANSSNTASSGSVLKSKVAGTSAGNALFQLDNTTDTQWTMGMAAATNSSFVISASGNIGTSDVIQAARTGNVNFVTSISLAGGTALSNYTEGTWTPTLVGETTAGTTTYASQVGFYTRIGNMVTVWGRVAISAATGTGNMLFGSLPFTVKNQDFLPGGTIFTVNVGTNFPWPAGTTMASFAPVSNSTNARMTATGSTTNSSNVQITNNSGTWYFQVTYQV